MEYKLRSIIAAFILGAALLGAKVEYLRRYAAFHEREADRFSKMIGAFRNVSSVEVNAALDVATEYPKDCRLDWQFLTVLHHRAAAKAYREAAYRPWTAVDEPPLPERHYDD